MRGSSWTGCILAGVHKVLPVCSPQMSHKAVHREPGPHRLIAESRTDRPALPWSPFAAEPPILETNQLLAQWHPLPQHCSWPQMSLKKPHVTLLWAAAGPAPYLPSGEWVQLLPHRAPLLSGGRNMSEHLIAERSCGNHLDQ